MRSVKYFISKGKRFICVAITKVHMLAVFLILSGLGLIFSSLLRDWVAIRCDQIWFFEGGYLFSLPLLLYFEDTYWRKKTEVKSNYYHGGKNN